MKKNDLFYILFFPVMPLIFFHLPAYFLAVSAITIFLYGWDKWAAVRNLWRVPECALLFWALAGGSPAAILMMFLCRHKVSIAKHRHFTARNRLHLPDGSIAAGLLGGQRQS